MVRKAPVRRKRKQDRHPTPPGSPPGTLVIDPEAPRPVLSLLAFGPDTVEERSLKSPAEVRTWLGKVPVVWLDVAGLGDAAVIQQVGEIFGLHHLALEDVVHVHQRAKVEPYADRLFIVARMIELVGERLESEQWSMFLGPGFVLTFQELPGDVFDAVRDRIRHGKGRARTSGADWLAYMLLDALIDAWFPVLERYGDRLDALEEELLSGHDPEMIQRIHEVKQDLRLMRRAVYPLRDAVAALLRESATAFHPDTAVYLRDCHDHCVQIMDLVETYRDLGTSLMETHMSMTSNRMNDVMRVLTVIATIFIPLTFVAGVYGMNFDSKVSPWNMPETEWAYGYPAVMLGMGALALAMLAWFRRKRWL
ncbi:MAG: magnesium transport protein CorA [Myxococcales bacterium]